MGPVVVDVVLHGDVEEQAHVAVGDLVEDLTALLASSNQAGETELTQLMARRGLAGTDQLGEVPNTELASSHQSVDDAKSPRVGEEPESLCEHIGRLLVEKALRKRFLSDLGRVGHETDGSGPNMNINSDVHIFIYRSGLLLRRR